MDIKIILAAVSWGIIFASATHTTKGSRYIKMLWSFAFSVAFSFALNSIGKINPYDFSWMPTYWPLLLFAATLVYGLVFCIIDLGEEKQDKRKNEEKKDEVKEKE